MVQWQEMHIEIRMPRPIVSLLAVSAVAGGLAWMQWQDNAPAESADYRAQLVQARASAPVATAQPAVPPPYAAYPMVMPFPMPYPVAMGQANPAAQPSGWPFPPAAATAAVVHTDPSAPADTVTRTVQAESARAATELSMRERIVEQEILARRQELLTEQVKLLETEMQARGTLTPEEREAFLGSVRALTSLLADRLGSEKLLKESLAQMWQAEAEAQRITQDDRGPAASALRLRWPVDPLSGISAYFRDPSYFKRFKFQHDAVDIPVLQGSPVRAATDGIVVKVRDNGYGYNSITLQHAGGVSTLYGHVTRFLVSEGDAVKAGQPIALSGGRPGTLGAGLMTTGPHVHFSVFKRGQAVDPLPFLPPVSQYVK